MFSFSFEHVAIGDTQGVYSTLKFTTLGRLEIERNSTHIPNKNQKIKNDVQGEEHLWKNTVLETCKS
jgi:hypothetical protein